MKWPEVCPMVVCVSTAITDETRTALESATCPRCDGTLDQHVFSAHDCIDSGMGYVMERPAISDFDGHECGACGKWSSNAEISADSTCPELPQTDQTA